jgi:PAS fold
VPASRLGDGRALQGLHCRCRRCATTPAGAHWDARPSLAVDNVEQALGSVGVPTYVLDTTRVVRWINAAAEQLVGDVRGRHFTSVVAPEDSRRARELFARKVLGTSQARDATGVLVSTAGTRVAVEISWVPLMSGERVVGVFLCPNRLQSVRKSP